MFNDEIKSGGGVRSLTLYWVSQNYRTPFIFEIFQQRRIARLNVNSDLDSPSKSLSNTL
jgi:hypothetical protein